MNNQYLTFFIRGEEYAVAILRVKEIIEFETVTRVPTTPAHVRGVINLRGAVLPVVDLAAKFGHGTTEPSRTTCIVVVETRLGDELLTIGMLADAVSEVLEIADQAIEPPPAFGTNIRVDFLVGMAKLDDRLALVLDIDSILSPAEAQQAIDAAVQTEPAAEVA
jgi:purine-binding chemotaxis protein CheW